ncbi:MAG: IclR family transcriptional regulator [Gammaproteobacteria bacterium]
MSSIQVIQRAGKLLDAIAGQGGTASLKIVSAETGLHPSTAFRILASLSEIGLVDRDSHGRYQLGPKLRQLATRIPMDFDLRTCALPVMESLRNRVGETVNLTVRSGDEIIYIERATSNRMMRVEQIIGSRAPLHITAVGKLMLGESGEQGIREYAERTGLPAFTPNTIVRLEALIAEIERCKRLGFAYDNEEAETGVGCLGVLLRDGTGTAIAGLSISSPIERRSDEWIPYLIEAGERLSQQIAERQNNAPTVSPP